MIFVHAHIFKNAGSTIDWSLQENFGNEFMIVRASPKILWENPEKFSELVQENAPLKAVSAHWVNLRDMDQWGFDCFPFIMLRNPLERARSVYNFERKQKEKYTESVTAAKKMTFSQYVEWSMSHPLHSVLQNHQTRHCSGRLLGPLTEEHLSSATQLLGQVAVTGIVDLYDETMVLLEEGLSRHGVSVDLSYIRQNATQEFTLTTAEKVEAVRESLGGLFEHLEDANRFDLMLYERSRHRLLEQCDGLSNFGERLASFRQRCEMLSNGEQSEAGVVSLSASNTKNPASGVLKNLWNRAFHRKT